MKNAKLIGRHIDYNSSISAQEYCSNNFLKIWHYHPELELDIIHSSTGIRFVGDHIENFLPSDIVLLGKNLPHLWLNDSPYFENDSQLKARATVVHFADNFISGIMEMPEMKEIHALLERSKLGIRFRGQSNNYIIKKAQKLVHHHGYRRVTILIDILGHLAKHEDQKVLSSIGFVNSFNQIPNSRMIPVYEYIMNNFKFEIKLEVIAEIANMNPSSFSRYFTKFHKKSFTQFLNEIRIGYACKLLIGNNSNISEVCYESGFNNISNFNRTFKLIKKMTPSDYIKLHTLAPIW